MLNPTTESGVTPGAWFATNGAAIFVFFNSNNLLVLTSLTSFAILE